MVALLKREFGNFFALFGGRKVNHGFKAKPRGEIDYDALCEDVARRYPKIIERLGE